MSKEEDQGWPEQDDNITRMMAALSARADEFFAPNHCYYFMRPPDHPRELRPLSSPRLRRRDWISGATGVIATMGCRPNQHDAIESAQGRPPRTDVPLRVLWMGDQADADVLQRTWASISEHPLDIDLIEPLRQHETGDAPDAPSPASSKEFFQRANAADVLLYPVSLMGELVSTKRVMPLLADAAPAANSESEIDHDEGVFARSEYTTLPVALRMATSFASEQVATPLGGYLPALLMGESSREPSLLTWDQYSDFVESTGGKCSEPTAPGWAGAMYLWRLASSLRTTWLFDRETLTPLMTQPDYVAVLQQMRDTVKKFSPEFRNLTPGQVYQRVHGGEMQAGIGFPRVDSATSGAEDQDDTVITFAALPGGKNALSSSNSGIKMRQVRQRSMVDPFMLVGSIASACRQTAAADTFLDWLAGGRGSEPLFRSISSLVDVAAPASQSSIDMIERYRAWLKTALSNPGFVPTLQLAGAAEYYAVLDEQVRACTLGDTAAEVACEQINDAWSRLHQKHDLPSQKRMWRRAQAMG